MRRVISSISSSPLYSSLCLSYFSHSSLRLSYFSPPFFCISLILLIVVCTYIYKLYRDFARLFCISIYKELMDWRGLLFFVPSLFYIAAVSSAFEVSTLTFDEGYSQLFGGGNLIRSSDDKSVRLLLDRSTGSGFVSSSLYDHGFFSASIKLPSNYTAGVVVAFYTSNGDVFEKTHDELDFEFLGNVRGKQWRVQTNVYGNGSTSRGREERYRLWFDPTKEFHQYSILWTYTNIIFYIDDVPIRELIRSEAMGSDYPSKPMALYATIWDGSAWATAGGRYKVDYRYSPFVSEFKDLTLLGCPVDPIQVLPTQVCTTANAELAAADFAAITPARRSAMGKFRGKYMTYYYCFDAVRYPIALPECMVATEERRRFTDAGTLKFGNEKRSKRRNQRWDMTKSASSQKSM